MTPTLIEACNPSPMTGRGNNTYLIAGGSGAAALIDAGVGHPEHVAAIARELVSRQLELRDVLVTHGHHDHAAGAPVLAAAYPDARFLKVPWPEEDRAYSVQWTDVGPGERLRVAGDLEVVALHTPGHSPDHTVFWHEASRSAFTGDLVVQGSSVMIHWSRGGDLGQYLGSLERLRALKPRVLYPAHGPVIDDPAAILTGYIEHRQARERQVLDALAAGRSTVQSIADFIYDGLDPALMFAARENVRAHLEKLRAEARARNEHDRWTT